MNLSGRRLFRILSATDSVDSRQETGLLNILVLSVGLAAGMTRVLEPQKDAFHTWHELFLVAHSLGGPIEQDKGTLG